MFKNYFISAVRNLSKRKIQTVISFFGLIIGFIVSILMVMFVRYEYSFDTFHKDYDSIYRVVQDVKQGNTQFKTALTSAKLGPEAAAQIAGVEASTRFIEAGRITLGNVVKDRDYEGIVVADSNFFEFFSFPESEGSFLESSRNTQSLSLSKNINRKYFSKESGYKKELFTNRFLGQVGSIFENFPGNSHLDMDVIVSHETFGKMFPRWTQYINFDWTSNSVNTYLKIDPKADISSIEDQIAELVRENYGSEEPFEGSFSLQALKDVHLNSNDITGGMNFGQIDYKYITLFLIIGILVLVIASFNYINLVTVGAVSRLREISLRKVVGASRLQIVLQFFVESLILVYLALIFSFSMIELFQQNLNVWLGKDLVPIWSELGYLTIFIGAGLLIVLITSIYPFIITTNLVPAKVLRVNETKSAFGFSFRKVLLLIQFTIALVMISTTIVIYNQLKYLQEKNIGFEKEGVIVMDINSGALRSNYRAILAEMTKLPNVKSAAVSSRVPGEWKDFPIVSASSQELLESGDAIYIGASQEFLETYGIDLVEGKNFQGMPSDSNYVLFSQSAAALYFRDTPIGKSIEIGGVNWGGNYNKYDTKISVQVIGIIADINFESLKETPKPLIIGFNNNQVQNIDYFSAKISTSNLQETVRALQDINNKFDTQNPLEYHFLDDQIDRFYAEDQVRGKLFFAFAGISILLSCLGLFAISTYNLSLKLREIGIRKIFGAQSKTVIWILSKEFLLIIIIALLISAPFTFWLSNQWLSSFAYRVSIGVDVFLIGALLTMFMVITTVSYHTIKAIIANPLNILPKQE